MIKNIIFDLSEVIISGYHGVEHIIEQNTNISSEEFLKRKKETINIFLDSMRGKYSEDEYIETLIEVLSSWIIEKIDNYNSSMYYENPDYIYQCYIEGKVL